MEDHYKKRQPAGEAVQNIALAHGFVGVGDSNVFVAKGSGPAVGEWPGIPVWEYLDVPHAAGIGGVLFPVVLYDGGRVVKSIDAFRAPGPFPPGQEPTVEEVVDLYARLHRSGVVAWNPDTRSIQYVRPDTARRAVLVKWWGDCLLRRRATGRDT